MRGLIDTHLKLAIAALCTVLLALLPTYASADAVIGTPGAGAGQVDGPQGVAVDTTDGLLYVADGGNNRINVFNANTGTFIRAFGWGVADGTTNALQVCTATCFKGIAGSGAGQLSAPSAVAVDNDPGSSAFHAVYVYDSSNRRVQRFDSSGAFVLSFGSAGGGPGQFEELRGLAVGPGGIVYVADVAGEGSCEVPGVGGSAFEKRVQKFTPAGVLSEPPLLLTDAPCGAIAAFVVDSGGGFYVANSGGSGAVRKYSATGVPTGAPFPVNPSPNIRSLAVGPDGELYLGENDGVLASVLRYSSGGALESVFYGTPGGVALEGRVAGLAAYPLSPLGDMFVIDEFSTRLSAIDFPPTGALVHPSLKFNLADPVGNTKATLKSGVNPEGKVSKYFFEYITDANYEAAGESFGAGTVKTSESTVPGAVDFQLHDISLALTTLTPETLYHARARAVNADGGPNSGPEFSFETKPPIDIGEAWSTGVGTDSATLHTEVNPLGIPATARFEYITEADWKAAGESFGAGTLQTPDLGASPISLGEGEVPKDVSSQVFDLKPGTSYRFRAIATDSCKPEPEPPCDFTGPEVSFTTFNAIAPPSASCANEAFRTGPAAYLPDCRGYEMVSPVDKNGSDVEALANIQGFQAVLDQAAADGGAITYSTYKAFGDIASAPYINQYLGRRDASKGWLTEAISPKREGPSIMTLSSLQLDRQYKYFSPDLCQGWVVQDANPILAPGAPAGYGGLYRRDNCGAGTGAYEAFTTVAPPSVEARGFVPEMQGASADGSVGVFSVTDSLTADTAPQSAECASESQGCQPRLYEAREGVLRNVCILPSGLPASGSCGAGTPNSGATVGVERRATVENAVSADGSRIFWSDSASGPGKLYVRIGGATATPETLEISSTAAQFWTAAADGSKAIYSGVGGLRSYDVESESSTLIAAGGEGVAGASDDASRVYFVSKEALAPGATAGQGNLYLWEEDGGGGSYRFIAALPTADVSLGAPSPVALQPILRTSRITPDGEQIAFMSRGQLTGYDNTDAVSKQADQEIYLYDSAAGGGAGKLLCVSCNPSNALPQGQQLTQKGFEGLWAAARIPGWESQLYGQRVLTDDGARLYFNSFEALVSRDTNGQEDVYQWEAPGSGDCTTKNPSYSQSNGGCIDLISSGESPKGSELVDIGVNGNDIFFKTSSSLVPQDKGLIDVYDARVSGGFPPPPEPPAPCEGDACASPTAPPNDPTPASAGFRGAGDPKPQGTNPRKACPKGKRKVRKAGKSRCVQQKKHQRKRHGQRSHKEGNR
jgi:DNA-binding beta-propeller fold protein YncE